MITALIILPLAVLFRPSNWETGPDPSGFVPDSGPLTIVYLGTVLGASIFAHKALRPKSVQSR